MLKCVALVRNTYAKNNELIQHFHVASQLEVRFENVRVPAANNFWYKKLQVVLHTQVLQFMCLHALYLKREILNLN